MQHRRPRHRTAGAGGGGEEEGQEPLHLGPRFARRPGRTHGRVGISRALIRTAGSPADLRHCWVICRSREMAGLGEMVPRRGLEPPLRCQN